MTAEEEMLAQQIEDQSPTQSTDVDDSVFAYNDNALKKLATTQPAISTTQASQPKQTTWLNEVGAANTVNKAVDFNAGANYQNTALADEHSLPLQILANNQVHFLQKDKRSKQQTASIARFLNRAYGTKITEDGSIDSENEITKVYNSNLSTIPESLYKQGYIQGKPETKEEKTEKLVKEAIEKKRSFLDIYNAANDTPVYDRPRANRLDQNSKASIIADIMKLVGEGVTTKKGGTPIVRQSAVPMLNAELQKLNDLYKNEVKAYKQGGFNAMLMDEQEKKRELIQKARDEAAKAVKQMEIDAAAKQKAEAQALELYKLDKQQKFTATENAKNRSTTLTAAQIRKQNTSSSSETKSTTNEKGDILIDGKIVKPKQAYVNDVAAKVKSAARSTDPVMGMSATEVFAANWNKYFDYVNGEFVPKGGGGSTATGDPLNLNIKKTKSNPLGLKL